MSSRDLSPAAASFHQNHPNLVNQTIVHKIIYPLLSCLLAMTLLGCNASLPEVPKLKVYKIDVAQGNIIDANQLAQLAVGMPQRHVRVLLGTPLVQDPFHPERWDYIYNLQPGGEARQQRQVSLFFNEQGELSRLEGDILGELRQTPAQITRSKTTVKVPALVKAEKVGIWRGLRQRLPFSGEPVKPKMVATAAAAAPPVISETEPTENTGFWSGLRNRLPFVGDQTRTDTDEAGAALPAATAITTATVPPGPPAIVPQGLTSPAATTGSARLTPEIPDSTDPRNIQARSAADKALQPGMNLSELRPTDETTTEQTDPEPQELDDRSGLFDGLLRKIGR